MITVAVAAGLVAAVVAVACIPDLETLAPPAKALDSGDASGAACGDGFIDLDLGEQCDPGSTPQAECTDKCQVSCLGGDAGLISPIDHHCYFAAQPQPTYRKAQDKCSTNDNAHVVTMASEDEWNEVTSSTFVSPFWIGLQFDVSADGYLAAVVDEPGWAPSCAGCFAHGVTSLPSGGCDDGGVDCLVSAGDPSAPWRPQCCAPPPPTLVGVVCEQEPVGSLVQRCNGFFCFQLAHTHGQKRYVFVQNEAAPDEATTGCAELGGHLIVFESREEREQVWHELLSITPRPSQIWIGASTSPDAGGNNPADWVWADDAGTPVGTPDAAYPSPWGVNEPKLDAPLAYSLHSQTPTVDNELAHADDAAVQPTAAYVCELPPADAGAP